MADQLLDDMLRAYLGEKIKRDNILNQNGANLVFLHGKSVGRELGLSDEDLSQITPFPSTTKIFLGGDDDQSPTESGVKATLRRILPLIAYIALGTGLGVGGGGWALNQLATPAAEQVVEEPIVLPIVDELNPNLGFTVQ